MSAQNNCSIMQIEVICAKNLRNAEYLSKSDPYCIVKFDDKADAQPNNQRSNTIDNNLNPEWGFKCWTLITDDVKSFDIKVYDKNMMRDTSLGYCRVLRPKPEQRALRTGGMYVLENGKGGQVEAYCTEIPLNTICSVMSERRDSLSAAARNYLDKFALLDLRIICAKGLKAADFNGKSDPYAVVTWDKSAKAFPKKVKTATINKTLNPTWESVFHILVDPASASSFRVDLFDEDIGMDDSLGHVNVPLNPINLGDKQDYAVVKGKGTVTIAHCLIPLSGLFI